MLEIRLSCMAETIASVSGLLQHHFQELSNIVFRSYALLFFGANRGASIGSIPDGQAGVPRRDQRSRGAASRGVPSPRCRPRRRCRRARLVLRFILRSLKSEAGSLGGAGRSRPTCRGGRAGCARMRRARRSRPTRYRTRMRGLSRAVTRPIARAAATPAA